MSGGVDSSLTAHLLKEEGWDVVGLFMKNWDDDECPAEKDLEDVARVAHQLDIPYHTVNFTENYWNDVFASFLEDYKRGITPNPDVLCNREIKFKALLDKALSLGGEFLATGHYARVEEREGRHVLLRGLDPGKDQSYFLCQVTPTALSRTLFPLGHLRKSQVRALAKERGLATAEKKDSTGICFIGKRKFSDFLGRFLKKTPGPMVTEEGKVIGEHEGLSFYTLGQRKGLMIGGPGDAWYVARKDLANNTLVVVQGENHPSLFTTTLKANELSFITEPGPMPFACTAKVRYRQEDAPCVIEEIVDGVASVRFLAPSRAATPGQFIVFYEGDVCLGGGRIL